MATSSRNRSARPSHPPLWLVEGLDVLQRKRWVLLAVTVAVIAVGALATVLFPATIPASAAVGIAVGVAALLFGLAAALAADATDLIVQGPRHVAAAGGELVAVLPSEASVVAAGPLAAAIQEVREPGRPLLLALSTAGRDARRTVAWTDALARALVDAGLGVLQIDLCSGRSDEPGLVEVIEDDVRLADVAHFEPGVRLARLRAGRDAGVALTLLKELPSRLPRDLDLLLVSLPSAVSRGVVTAASALDHVLLVAERDRTSRVDVIANLDALEAGGTEAQVVLLDTRTAMRLAPPVEVDTTSGPSKRTIASTVGMPPVIAKEEGAAGGVEDAAAAPEEEGAAGGVEDAAAAPEEEVSAAPTEDDTPASEPPLREPAAPREVEVLEAAAEASAAAFTEADRRPEASKAPSDGGDDQEADAEQALHPDGQHDTDRIPRVAADADNTATSTSPGSMPADPPQEDLLRTTAQLAILAEDLQRRDAPSPQQQHASSEQQDHAGSGEARVPPEDRVASEPADDEHQAP